MILSGRFSLFELSYNIDILFNNTIQVAFIPLKWSEIFPDFLSTGIENFIILL